VEFDAVVVPGGYAPDMMRRHDAMVKLVRDAAQQGKVVAAICHAGWMLASAGCDHGQEGHLLLFHQGRHGECGWSVVGQRGGGGRQPDHVAEPDDLPAFCREIVRALAKTA
jgi:protease I